MYFKPFMVNTMTLRKTRLVAGWILVFLLPTPQNCYAFGWQDLWMTQEQQAQQEFLDENYQQAAEQFTDPAWQAAAKYKSDKTLSEDEQMLQATTDTGFYNQGNVLAKSGQLEKAIESYKQALKLNPANADAKHNKEIVEKELEKQQQQESQENNQDQNQDKDQEKKDQSGDQKQQDQQSQDSNDQEQQSEDQSEQQAENSEQQNPENNQQQDASEQEQEKNKDSEQAEAKAAETEDQEQDKTEAAQEKEADAQQDEQQQANEQWLKRIPDDPSGLLKRKFKYQYGRQQQRQNSEQQW